jgi:shikimate kinase/3-dehydroquinate synthase
VGVSELRVAGCAPGDGSADLIFLYGPPGVGKTTVGQALSAALDWSFIDLDSEIEAEAGQTVADIFAAEGEASFRARERRRLRLALEQAEAVVALGGGALLDPENRALVQAAGELVCLAAPLETLARRLESHGARRPLLAGAGGPLERLAELLAGRAGHYASFAPLVETGARPVEAIVWEIQLRCGRFFVRGMGPRSQAHAPEAHGYPVLVQAGGLARLGKHLRRRGLGGPVALVCDQTVAERYAGGALASLESSGFACRLVTIPAGEAHKTVETAARLWQEFLAAGLERGSTVAALGGGVVSDLAGFAAATYLRGVPWVALPTTLLAMVDASLGGKTGADLPQGKNLVGAYHPPRLVLADPATLASLPPAELRSGLAEVLKAGLLGDQRLFALCQRGWQALTAEALDGPTWSELVRRAMAVKIAVIQADPYEQGQRALLNLGHTIGHAVELVSGYRLRHGEAVAIGLALEAQLAEEWDLAEPGLAQAIREALAGLGLPTELPVELDPDQVLHAMGTDKKRAGGQLRFALPVRLGEARLEPANLRRFSLRGKKVEPC